MVIQYLINEKDALKYVNYLYCETCYKSWSGLSLTRPGPRPAQYLEDGEIAEALERGEREPTLGEREAATKLGEKETISFS